jgi:hypothetical protein
MESKPAVEITRAQCGAGAPALVLPDGRAPVLHRYELIVIYSPERTL